MIVTHVHIAHVGWKQYLLAAGLEGPILCREPSAKLLSLILEDATKLGVSRDQAQVQRYVERVEATRMPT